MASGSQLVSRITQQRRITQGMLSPGRKNGPGGLNAPLSPVAADFAGRKFQFAAKKMRILGEDSIRSLLPRAEKTLSADIASKFKDIERIIHINPKTIRDGSIWSEVEATLPGGGHPVQQPSGPEAGMLQQGSVIQKFSTVPKPEQSLESFRQQIESQPRPSRPTVARKKKAAVSPGDRLFSRVQEITPAQKMTENDQIEAPPVPEREVETEKHQVETPAAIEKVIETRPPESKASQKVSRQSVAQHTETPVKIQRQIEIPVVEKQLEEIEEEPDREPAVEVQENVPASEIPVQVEKLEEEVVEDAQKSPPVSEIAAPPVQKVLPIEKKQEQKAAIKQAKPVEKNKAEVKQAAVKKAHPIVQPTVQREERAVVRRQPSSSLKPLPAKAVTQVDASQQAPAEGISKAEKAQPEKAKEAVSPSVDLPKNAEVPEMPVAEQDEYIEQVVEDVKRNVEPVAPNFAEEEAVREMPLRQVLAERRQAAVSVVRRAEPIKTKQVQKPILTHIAGPMIAAQKTRSNVMARTMAEMPAAQQDQPVFRPGGPQSISSKTSPSQVDFQPFATAESEAEQSLLEMPVATREVTVPQVKAPEKQEKKAELKQKPAQKLPAVPAITKAANIVQRQWEEHTGVEGQGSGGASQGAEDNGEDSSLDLEALAEDVFPYVKRILEIESDRISGKFR